MISNSVLKAMLEKIPDDSKLFAYEGGEVGLVVKNSDGSTAFITASEDAAEDVQDDNYFKEIYVK